LPSLTKSIKSPRVRGKVNIPVVIRKP
jgi:hypothetical protein